MIMQVILKFLIFLEKLEIAKKCDADTKIKVLENMKIYDLLSLSKDQLKNKIPVKIDPTAIKNCEEAQALRKDLDILEELREKCMDVINKIFQTLNEDNIIPQFIQVLQKKTTEKTVFADNKPKYESMFKELEAIGEEIKVRKLSIKAKNEVFIRAKEKFKPDTQNEQVINKYLNIVF